MAISTPGNTHPKFIVNKYDDIDGSRVNQETPRGRLAFRDTDGRMTLPRTWDEANKAVFPVDWAKPLNPGPYFEGPGLNGAGPYALNDGSLNAQENSFLLDPNLGFQVPWPVGVKQFDLPPALYGLPVTSGNKCLVYEEGTFTYGSGNFVGAVTDYDFGGHIYAEFAAGDEGKISYTASGTATAVGTVIGKDVFGQDTITVKMYGASAVR